jgi:hypothetical protein
MSRTRHHKDHRKHLHHVPADYRRNLNRQRKAKVKSAMQKGNYETLPIFKQDALYDYL